MGNNTLAGHLSALFSILIWGVTFTSTKLLLRYFTPVEIQVLRNIIAFMVLYLVKPQKLVLVNKWHELFFAAAGLCGITLYHICESTSMTYTSVANTSLIVATSPFLIALLSSAFLQAEKPGPMFYLGFLLSIAGIAVISFNGRMNLQLNPVGDLLALCASAVWAVYSILTKKASAYGYSTIQITRRVFGYSLLFSLPLTMLADFQWKPAPLIMPVNLLNLLFLGICASALCFATWNYAVKLLGAVRTSV